MNKGTVFIKKLIIFWVLILAFENDTIGENYSENKQNEKETLKPLDKFQNLAGNPDRSSIWRNNCSLCVGTPEYTRGS